MAETVLPLHGTLAMAASAGSAATAAEGDAGEDGAAGRVVKSSSAFRTISEVADELDVAQHVLRFWESKFPQVRPLKRGGGRRYYRPEDVELLRQIRSLLYDEGYTIKGAQKLLRARRVRPGEAVAEAVAPARPRAVALPARAVEAAVAEPALVEPSLPDDARQRLESILDELREARELLDSLLPDPV